MSFLSPTGTFPKCHSLMLNVAVQVTSEGHGIGAGNLYPQAICNGNSGPQYTESVSPTNKMLPITGQLNRKMTVRTSGTRGGFGFETWSGGLQLLVLAA